MRPTARRSLLVLGAALLLLAGCTDPTGGPDENPAGTGSLPELAGPLPVADIARFSSVVMLDAGSNCTGTVIDTGVAQAPAYVLTNGHCVGAMGASPQQTKLGQEWFGSAVFFRAAGNLDGVLTVPVTELAYATMRSTDTGIVRLDATLGDLEALGVRPVPLAAEEPEPGAAVTNVGVPVQDLMDEDWVLRAGSCTLGEQSTVIEFRWLWFHVWSNDCPGIVQGSSGSPLFETGPDGTPTEVVAMINTTTWGTSAEDGGACFLHRPCVLQDTGPVLVEETSYAQSVAGVGECFPDGVFALGGGCPLPNSSLWTEFGGGAYRGGDLPDAAGRTPVASFVGAEQGSMRTALLPLGDGTACTEQATYAGAEELELPQASEPWELVGAQVPVQLPQEEGWWLLCAVAGTDHAGAASVLYQVDRTPPVIEAGAVVEDIGGGAVTVLPITHPPEIQTVRFTWGDPDTVDCDDPSGFQDFMMVPLTLLAEDLPALYCVYGMDSAGNPTPVVQVPLG